MKISRREFVSASSMSVAAVGFGPLRLLGQTPATPPQTPAAQPPPTPKWEDIRRGIGIFTASGGTIGYLITNDGAIAVDSQFMPSAEPCVAGLKAKAPKGIELLINTHHHADHVSGNPAFRQVV